jgi:hypothetical protein
MIVEFQLSLEGQAARWYAQEDTSTFTTFQELVDKFQGLFQVKIDPTEVLKEYLLFVVAASGGVSSGIFATISCSAGHVGCASSRGHLETSISEGTTRITTVFFRLD